MLSNHKLAGAIVMVCFAAIVWSKHHGPITVWQVVGMLIAVPSVGLWLVARLQLGKSFTATAQARELVTTGLYSKIRNPIYFFGLMFLTGVLIYLQQFWWLLAVPVPFAFQFWRSRNEEAVLEAKFGQQYRDYRAKTWF